MARYARRQAVDIEFALHDGVASSWAQGATSGGWTARTTAGHWSGESGRVDHFDWVACDNRTTRAVAKVLREDYGIPRKSIKAQAYWVG